MPGPVFLATDDGAVTLRVRERDDTAFVRANVNDPGVRRLLRNTTPKNARMLDEEFEEHADSDGGHGFLACAPADPVGHVGIWGIDHVNGTAWLGAWVAPEHHGREYAPRATALLVEYAFAELNLAKVRTAVYEPNEPSQRVMEKLGFTREGVLRKEMFIDGERVDTYRYGLLREEWTGDGWL